ncbi:creatininase family protein [Pelagovum pacificum]|uniref:Creatininase family protein n=1 Tax=Pelagovum pacificum TaxID=2588711 RepID=A0A5C5GGK5_9RHOB|nr:creatininase family protein [Pelagovum pacificum]QQA44212.1 creatininase family protein [Pelagovum pacificum]TNY32666.1 creatininase family protein [Pelagovum pacificum]
MKLDYAQMTWGEAGGASDRLAILPLGATEQHGPHLPLTVDTVLATGVARALADRIGAVCLPPITYGDAWNNEAFPGTISLSPETLAAVITDVGRGVERIGHPALITLNGHFGNRGPAAEAAVRLADVGLPVLALDYPGLEDIAARHCDSIPAGNHFFHADEVETSMMFALAPDVVRLDKAAPEYPEFPEDFGTRPMQLREFNESGAFGDPRPATAEKGAAMIAEIVENCLPLIAAFCEENRIGAPAWPR